MTAPNLIDIRNLTVRYPSSDGAGERTILDQLSLNVRNGELVTVIGPSGCGKSTLLRQILGCERPTEGSVTVDGKLVDRVSPERGIVYQSYALAPNLTVLDTVTLGPILSNSNLLQRFIARPFIGSIDLFDRLVFGKARGASLPLAPAHGQLAAGLPSPASAEEPPAEKAPRGAGGIRARAGSLALAARGGLERALELSKYYRAMKEARGLARELLFRCGLDPDTDGDKYPFELSGGMRQRVAIAQALIMQPKILLMDEPFGALDQTTREGMQDCIHEQWQRHKITVFFVTHDLEEACKIGTRLICLSQYWTSDDGREGVGARIMIDKLVVGGAEKPSRFVNSDEFRRLVTEIRQRALDKTNRQPVSAFELTHPDAFKQPVPASAAL